MGTLPARTPWYVIAGAALCITISVVMLIFPALTPRRWTIPTPEQVMWTGGRFEERIGTKSPYVLRRPDGSAISLRCAPAGMQAFNDCLAEHGLPTPSPPVQVGYFIAQGTYFPSNVLIVVRRSSRSYISYQTSVTLLRELANVRDDNGLQVALAISASGFIIYFGAVKPLLRRWLG